jgi:outer membrane protein OmpA-like peptidoglycan-associated protein
MIRLRSLLPVVSLLALGLAPAPARAEFPSPAVYIGVFGGGHFRLADWDVGNQSAQYVSDRAFGQGGLRLGVHVLPQLALEAEVSYIALTHHDSRNDMLSYDLNLLYHFLKKNWSPVIEVGGGGLSNLRGNLGKDTIDPRIHVGLGVRGLVTPWMALRVDLRDVITDGAGWGSGNNLELLAGLDFFVFRAEKKVVKPVEKPADRDGDGVLDKDDPCPDVAGPIALHGCPDRDKDGIPDKDDACPDIAGVKEFKGCPDRDKDGIPDAEDRCPDVAGPKEFKGCPDRDKDGIPDIDDACPDQAGLKDYKGCLPEKAKAFAGTIQGIVFDTGKSTIRKSSNKTLDGAVAVLKEFPTIRLRIEGHTDNVGDPQMNQKLSEDRANAVRDYLVKKGIAGDRLEAAGFGETRPVKDNATAEGRQSNRRIDFVVLAEK